MKVLGLLFILVGIWFCISLWLLWPGAIALGLGGLFCIAGRGSAPGVVVKGASWALGGLIAVSLVVGGIELYDLAHGVTPAATISPAAANSSPTGLHSSQPAQPAKHHPITH